MEAQHMNGPTDAMPEVTATLRHLADCRCMDGR